jgi:large subunit ribosomal protein L15
MMHTLAPARGAREKSFRVGRGNGSGRGKTAGRGTKGQRSRSGGRSGLKLKGLKQMLLSFPKVRGFQSRYDKARVITLAQLERMTEGSVVTMEALRRADLVLRTDHSVKIVASEGLTKKLTIRGIKVSAGAKEAIEKLGGTVVAVKKVVVKKGKKIS